MNGKNEWNEQDVVSAVESFLANWTPEQEQAEQEQEQAEQAQLDYCDPRAWAQRWVSGLKTAMSKPTPKVYENRAEQIAERWMDLPGYGALEPSLPTWRVIWAMPEWPALAESINRECQERMLPMSEEDLLDILASWDGAQPE